MGMNYDNSEAGITGDISATRSATGQNEPTHLQSEVTDAFLPQDPSSHQHQLQFGSSSTKNDSDLNAH